jgi:hypothetical protein
MKWDGSSSMIRNPFHDDDDDDDDEDNDDDNDVLWFPFYFQDSQVIRS